MLSQTKKSRVVKLLSHHRDCRPPRNLAGLLAESVTIPSRLTFVLIVACPSPKIAYLLRLDVAWCKRWAVEWRCGNLKDG